MKMKKIGLRGGRPEFYYVDPPLFILFAKSWNVIAMAHRGHLVSPRVETIAPCDTLDVDLFYCCEYNFNNAT